MKGRGGVARAWPDRVVFHAWFRRRVAPIGLMVGVLLALVFPLTAAAAPDPAAGYDVSFPNCQGSRPVSPGGYLVVGVNGGRAFTPNPCFADEYRWAAATGQVPSIYMNLNYPSGPGLDQAGNGPRGACAASDLACRAYNYGYNAAAYADGFARANSPGSPRWWLDVETVNVWSSHPDLNAAVIQGAIDDLRQQSRSVGIYSVPAMWQKIAGAYAPGLPIWVARTNAAIPVLAYCGTDHAFGGGTALMVQSWDSATRLDFDFVCPGQSLGAASGSTSAIATSSASSGGVLALGAAGATGQLANKTGGSSVSYTLDYPGNNAFQTVTLDFWPHGLDVSNGIYLRVTVAGQEVAKVHATDTPQPGHLALTFSARASGPAVVELVSYVDSSAVPAIGYSLRP